MSELCCPTERWKIVLVERRVFIKPGRSKKRRIVNKWRKQPANWKPLMSAVGFRLMMGTEALRRAQVQHDPYWNHADPSRYRQLEMHPLLWQRIQLEKPNFAARCDLFLRHTVVRNGIQWHEDVPFIPPHP